MKTKILFLLLLVGVVNFSCSDDKEDTIIPLKAGKLSITEGKVGDEVTLSGEGFSETLAENSVYFNEVQATILAATNSELKVTVPEGTTTGKVSVKVGEQSIDFGVFTIRKETLFIIKSDYSNEGSKATLITMDPGTGAEEIFCELPALESNWLYTSITYLAKTNEIAILAVSEEDGKDVALCKVNLDTKTPIKLDLTGEDRYYYYDLFADKNNNLYAIKSPDMSHLSVSLMKIDPSTGTQETFYENSESDVYDMAYPVYLEETNEVIVMVPENDDWDISKLFKINLDNGNKTEIPLSVTGDYEALVADKTNNLYFIKEQEDPYKATLIKLNIETGVEESVVELSSFNYYYGNPVYYQTTNELIFTPEDEEDANTFLLKVNLEKKTTQKVELNPGEDIDYESMLTIDM